jgi:hypothetical protein
MKLKIGFIVSLIFTALIIWSIENQYCFWQIFIAFISFIVPTIFLSALKNNVAFFFLLTFTILFVYLSYKYGFTDVWVGLALAFTLGFPIHYYKVRHTKVD